MDGIKKLEGKRIALLGSRKIEEQCAIVEKWGGIAISRPAQGTVLLDDTIVQKQVQKLLEGQFDWMIFTTGIGIDTLYKAAEREGKSDSFLSVLQKTKIAARGYKTINMLKKLSLSPLVKDDDGSTAGLVRALTEHPFKGMRVALQLHGDPAPTLMSWLNEQQADSEELLPYVHIPPEESTMQLLFKEIQNGEVDALFFTSTPQVRHFFHYAKEKGLEKSLLERFTSDIIILAVGKVTAQALRDHGIDRLVYPEHERMGSAIVELCNYYSNSD